MDTLKWSLVLGLLAVLPGCGGDADGALGAAGAGGGHAAGQGGGSPAAGAPSHAGSSNGGGAGAGTGGAGAGGTGGARGDDTFMSSFPGTTVLGSLTGSAHDKLCAEYNASPLVDAVLEAICLQKTLFQVAVTGPKSDAAARATCSPIFAACLQTNIGTLPCAFDASCTATVSELERCTNDNIGVAHAFSAALPACEQLTLAALNAADLNAELGEAPSCTGLDQKCPDPKDPGK